MEGLTRTRQGSISVGRAGWECSGPEKRFPVKPCAGREGAEMGLAGPESALWGS